MSKRIMPSAGYYLEGPVGGPRKYQTCWYVSGGTKGNFYYDATSHGKQWNCLTWTCVPSKARIAVMSYSAGPPPGFPPHP